MFELNKTVEEECVRKPINDYIPSTIKRYREVLDYCIFDTIKPQKVLHHNFFDVPCYQYGKTKEDTNLKLSRLLSFSERFMATRIFSEIRPFYARISKNHGVRNLSNILDGHIQLMINNRMYQELPLTLITNYSLFLSEEIADRCSYCGAPITGFTRCEYCKSAINGDMLSHPLGREISSDNKSFKVANPYVLTPGTPFWVEVTWKEPTTETNNLSLRFYLGGQLERTVE